MLTLERINKARQAGYDDDAIVDSISRNDPAFGERISKAKNSGYDSSAIMQSIERKLNQPLLSLSSDQAGNSVNVKQLYKQEKRDVKPDSKLNVKQLDNEKNWFDHFAEGMSRSVSGGAQESKISEDPGF